jgi:hypothetical protein
MENTMSLNKILAALLVVIFVIFSLVVVLAWSVRGRLLEADVYVGALEEADFFELPYQLIRDGDIPEAGDLLLKEGPLSVVSGAELEAVARELAPPNWLRAQLERALRDLLAVVDEADVDEMPGLVLSLREVKTRALGEPGQRALNLVVAALPECAPGQTPIDLSNNTPICTPPGVDLGPFLDQLKVLLAPLVERVPDTYRVSWQPQQQDVLDELQRAGQALDQLQVALLLLAGLNLALLGLIWLLAVRSAGEWLRWTGGPLLLLGLLVLLVAFSAPRLVAWGLDNSAGWNQSGVPLPVSQALQEALRDLALVLFHPAQRAGAILAVTGLLLLLVSPLFPGRRRVMVVQ